MSDVLAQMSRAIPTDLLSPALWFLIGFLLLRSHSLNLQLNLPRELHRESH